MSRTLLKISKSVISRCFSQQSSSGFSVEYLKGTDNGIVVIGFNDNKTRNALGREFTKSLYGTLDDITNDSAVRVVLFRSLLPKVFCAGANLKERVSMSQSETKTYVSFLRHLMMKIQNVPIPTIAAIDGAALGGGLELSLSCDIRVASESARIGLVETKLAILPGAGGTQRLPRLIGPSLAKELIFTARILNGNEAKQYGIVNHCVPDNGDGTSAYIKAMEIAREIIPNGPAAVKLAKFAIDKGQEVDIHQGCAIEELCYAQVIPTKDRIEGLQAFLEKRTPVYSGV